MSVTPPYYHDTDLFGSMNWQQVGHHEQHAIQQHGPFAGIYQFVVGHLFKSMPHDLACRIEVNSVSAVHNKQLTRMMSGNIDVLEKRHGDPVFQPKWPSEPNSQHRIAVMQQLQPFIAHEKNGVKVCRIC